MCANNESRNAGWQERGPEVLAFMADTLGSDTALELLRRGAGDLGNEERVRWKQEVRDFLIREARRRGKAASKETAFPKTSAAG
jgi:hypothetical protein